MEEIPDLTIGTLEMNGEYLKRKKRPANATKGNRRLPRRPTKLPCCSPSETEISTPFLARMSTSSGSLGSVTVARLPSTAVSYTKYPFPVRRNQKKQERNQKKEENFLAVPKF